MSRLTLDGVACATPASIPLFADLTLSIDREIVGLFGRNGAGKSTLLDAIAGGRPPAAGTILVDGRIGLLRQLAPAGDRTIAELLGVDQALARLDRVEVGRASESDLAEADWSLPAHLAATLARVGLPPLGLGRPVASLSGGERTRVRLAALLLPEPDILLLDEPTNNLDDEGRAAVADLLAGWNGAALVASHDRALLERVDRIVELSSTTIRIVGGGWSAFERQRAADRARAVAGLEQAQADYKGARREKQREREKQDRRDRYGRAVAARDIDPRILLHAKQQRAERTAARYRAVGDALIGRARDALDRAEAEVERLVPIRITLPPSRLPTRHRLVEAVGLCCERGGRSLFGPLDLTIIGPERIALTGANGTGKTSLIRLILGLDRPASGEIAVDRDRIALLDQHLAMLDAEESLLDAMRRHQPAMDGQAAHAALAGYGFRNRWASRLVGSLSGGERVRLALACLFSGQRPPQLLVLDEPTNHLDLEAIELLEAALRDYDGALLCVSHDPAFRKGLGLMREIKL